MKIMQIILGLDDIQLLVQGSRQQLIVIRVRIDKKNHPLFDFEREVPVISSVHSQDYMDLNTKNDPDPEINRRYAQRGDIIYCIKQASNFIAKHITQQTIKPGDKFFVYNNPKKLFLTFEFDKMITGDIKTISLLLKTFIPDTTPQYRANQSRGCVIFVTQDSGITRLYT